MTYDAVVVGAGPNGLAAATTIAQAGRSVLVIEAAPTVGGGTRSAELTLPGFVHDVCSAIHPLGAASPYLSTLPLARHGLRWLEPDVPLAHPLDSAAQPCSTRPTTPPWPSAKTSRPTDDGSDHWSRVGTSWRR